MENQPPIANLASANTVSPYILIWEFTVRSDLIEIFKEKYGSHGIWATFFRSDPGYIRTELVQDTSNIQRFLTLDFWVSKKAYDVFRSENQVTYERIDAECVALTEKEMFLGTVDRQRE